jgi:hypothetical protein
MWVGLVGALAVLHFFVMQAPVWHLISRIDLIGGSTGWHRYIIFDAFLDSLRRLVPHWLLDADGLASGR